MIAGSSSAGYRCGKRRWRGFSAYGNIGYMGPGLALAVLGSKAAAPTALIFCCDSIFLFSIVPLLIELTDRDHPSFLHAFGVVIKQDRAEPADHVGVPGALVAARCISVCRSRSTIWFCFAKRGGADGAVQQCHGGAPPVRSGALEVPGVIAIKLLIHPLVAFGLMLLFGPFAQPWAATAVLMASLPPALNVFVIARQNNTWIEPASVAVLIGTFAPVVTLTSVMWFIQTGRLVFP